MDFHGPHDNQSLLDPAFQLDALDSFGACAAVRAAYAGRWEALRALQQRLKPRSVTVLLTADEAVLYERYLDRDRAHTRHPGHAVSDRYPPQPGDPEVAPQEREGFAQRYLDRGMGRVNWDGPVIEVDTTDLAALDRDGLVARVRELIK